MLLAPVIYAKENKKEEKINNDRITIDTENVPKEKAFEILYFFSKINNRNFSDYMILKLTDEERKECFDFYKNEKMCASEYLFYSRYSGASCDGRSYYVDQECLKNGHECTYKFYDDDDLGACE